MKVKKLPKDLHEKLFKLVPRVTTDAIIVKGKKVLLIKRDIPPCKGDWHLCGGTVLKGETLRQTLQREVREETGLKVKILKYAGYYDQPGRDQRGTVITHVFICQPIGGKLRGSFEGRELRFFAKLPKNIGFDHKKILRDAGFK